jgi:hypothetical protein
MRQRPCQERVRELIDTDPPADELARMARTDALLREVAVRSPEDDGCGQTRTSISAALDGEASEVELDRIQRHAERCPSCQAFLSGAKRLATTLQGGAPARPRLKLVSPAPNQEPTREKEGRRQKLKVSVAELALIYKSLEAAKTLHLVPPQDELLEDTMQLVDQALRNA